MAKRHTLNITEIEDEVKSLLVNLNKETFIEDFLSFYDIPKTSITRAKQSTDGFFIRNKVRYARVEENPLVAFDEIRQEISEQKQKPRYVIATDFIDFYAKDTKTEDSLAIKFEDLASYADFFLAWNGIEKVDYQKENPADIKAAERFTKLYDELVKINPELALEERDGKSFNHFLIRALFLYFAEDTEIIAKNSFTNVLKQRTAEDGSNLNTIIKELFEILDIPDNKRENQADWLIVFPYVNGKLFQEAHHDLNFNTYTRKLLIEAGELLRWDEINPDILGAMIQTVANKEARQTAGMHYTSVPNILKVIKPLFLDDLQAEYQRLSDRADDYQERDITEEQRRKQQRDIIIQLERLIERMSKIKFLDPACGSGNFLIITYKELRRLEIACLVKSRDIREALGETQVHQGSLLKESKIGLSQFSGIELDDFAHEVARLSLYIAEHQMNLEMTEALADYQPRILPLKESGNIVHANALRVDWEEVVPHEADDEVYIMGNPPYIGAKLQTKEQKKDLEFAISPVLNFKKLDYISGWFYKATKYIYQRNSQYAFVTTNSINQGEQVSQLWLELLKFGQISFAYQSFKWGNSASHNAGVTVTIIGFSNHSDSPKTLFINEVAGTGENINPYLTFGDNIIVSSLNKSISNFPEIVLGSKPVDFGNLIFTEDDYKKAVNMFPKLVNVLKMYIGADDYINGTRKFALWLNEDNHSEFEQISIIHNRVKKVEESRLSGGTSAKAIAKIPYRFFTYQKFENALKEHYEKSDNTMYSILVPSTSSETREYVPIGLVDDTVIISSASMAIYDAPIWLLGILTSRMHMTWLRAVGGKLETRYRYSAGMVYNTFPIPQLSQQRKNKLEEAVLDMLDVREEEGGTLAELYGGANKPMNQRLREAHEVIDGIVERAYRQEPFNSDEERLSVLLKLYQEMTKDED
ncbi:class I SAM-dependent DNA methyltransferase [Lactococcus formosensis]|jgi:type II restriction/modification system DNA methylase subunit YeeA|uniref:site-specific DNA-methyltransferase (adenine-specific) n=1 Tax=Lactococcus formosensis TaxID=1281486 RepID=A0A9Q8Y2T6_9LACT|nr:DNA methyltransferase [Lactococcus formosensis]USJ20751.1 N-6 DNA methylase [Lactococcus formosensis]